jgi:hypothetical protein
VYSSDRLIGRLDTTGTVSLDPGSHHLRLVGVSAFFERDLGTITLRAGERQTFTVPGVASAVISVQGDVYAGVRIFVDERAVSGPYPAQLPRLAEGTHAVRFTWLTGPTAGKELKRSFEVTSGGHFLVRAVPANDQVDIQQTR